MTQRATVCAMQAPLLACWRLATGAATAWGSALHHDDRAPRQHAGLSFSRKMPEVSQHLRPCNKTLTTSYRGGRHIAGLVFPKGLGELLELSRSSPHMFSL
jgi:hypothetical protein